jgi:DNA invertase Pin-like site-specific DNA recombinase
MPQSSTADNVPRSAPQTTAGKPKAYSYVRFSTPEQELGDSYRRQTDLAKVYADKHGLELDTTLRLDDRGVSAYQGRNATVGALGAFRKAVIEGDVPQGSYLIVESLDRISRQTVRKAVRTLEDIVEAGVCVVDLSDGGKVYSTSTLDEGYGFLVMAIRFMRAHEESALKAIRIAGAYEEKRRIAASGEPQDQPFTRMLPGWLRWNEQTKRHETVEERATLLRDIFGKADAGWSKHRIARHLNEARVEPWGKGKRKGTRWHSSYIQKLLTNSAVIGTFTPHKAIKSATGRKRLPQQPIERHFPAVVDQDVFARVSAHAKARAARGKHADNAPKSVFAGLLRCGTVWRHRDPHLQIERSG